MKTEGERYMEQLIEEEKISDNERRKQRIIDLKFKASVIALHVKHLQDELEKL